MAFFLNWRGPLSNVVIEHLIEKSCDTISGQVVTLIPGPVVWALLFFLMLISLALGSIFAAFETILAALSDQWPQLRYTLSQPYRISTDRAAESVEFH